MEVFSKLKPHSLFLPSNEKVKMDKNTLTPNVLLVIQMSPFCGLASTLLLPEDYRQGKSA